MKAIYLHVAGAMALTFGLAACVSSAGSYVSGPKQAPAATPPPTPTPTPTPTSLPAALPVIEEPRYDNYLDAPQTDGTWSYGRSPGGTSAAFGLGQEFAFVIGCDRPAQQIILSRLSERTVSQPAVMSIQTETTSRQLALSNDGSGYAAALSANDPLLDAMAITKGRFAVEMAGQRTLYLPAWVEVSRVIEDCR